MSRAAEILKRMYDAGRIGIEGLRKAVSDGVITEEEFREIVGETPEER